MSTFSGFVIGYVLGAKTGPQAFEKLGQYWEVLAKSPEVAELVTSLFGRNGELGQKLAKIADEKGDLMKAWEQIKQSPEFESVVGGGMSFASALFSRGKSMLEDKNSGSSH